MIVFQVPFQLNNISLYLYDQILVANKMACELFDYHSHELVGMRMSSLLTVNDRNQPEALMEQHIESSGEVVMVSGKVVSRS